MSKIDGVRNVYANIYRLIFSENYHGKFYGKHIASPNSLSNCEYIKNRETRTKRSAGGSKDIEDENMKMTKQIKAQNRRSISSRNSANKTINDGNLDSVEDSDILDNGLEKNSTCFNLDFEFSNDVPEINFSDDISRNYYPEGVQSNSNSKSLQPFFNISLESNISNELKNENFVKVGIILDNDEIIMLDGPFSMIHRRKLCLSRKEKIQNLISLSLEIIKATRNETPVHESDKTFEFQSIDQDLDVYAVIGIN